MSGRTTLGLLLAVLAAGGALWWARLHVPGSGEREAAAARLWDLPVETVTRLAWEGAGDRVELVREGEEWRLARPVEGRADAAVIHRLLTVLEELPRVEAITPRQRIDRDLSLTDYGLDPPAASLVIGTRLGSHRLAVGTNAPLGRYVYVQADAGADVLVTAASLLEALPAGLEDLRDRLLLPGQPARVHRLEVERPGSGFMQILRIEAGWMIQQPVHECADAGAVMRLLDQVFALRAERFVWDPRPRDLPPGESAAVLPGGGVEGFGLAPDEARLRIRLWPTGEELGRELLIGKGTPDGSRLYARIGSGGVVELPAAAVAALEQTVDALRPRQLVMLDPARIRFLDVRRGDRHVSLAWQPDRGWSMLEPFSRSADGPAMRSILQALTAVKVLRFVDVDPAANGANGREPSLLRLTVSAADDRGAAPADTAPRGERRVRGVCARYDLQVPAGEEGATNRLVHSTGQESAYEVSADAFAFFDPVLESPLALFDRTVVALDPARLRRLSLQRGEAILYTVERDAAGNWSALSPAGGPLNPDRLADLLFRLANLRALRVEANEPAELATYGLAGPEALALTATLDGEGAAAPTILVGFRVRTEGMYAMLKGQPVVFVLDPATAEGLVASLVRGSD